MKQNFLLFFSLQISIAAICEREWIGWPALPSSDGAGHERNINFSYLYLSPIPQFLLFFPSSFNYYFFLFLFVHFEGKLKVGSLSKWATD